MEGPPGARRGFPLRGPRGKKRILTSESVSKVHEVLQSFLSMRRIEARRRKITAVRLRFSQSLASLRQRFNQAMERSALGLDPGVQRFGRRTKPFAASERLTISTSIKGRIVDSAV